MSRERDMDLSELGPNMWLIDEMYRRYRQDPEAVAPGWQEFFADFTPRHDEEAVQAARDGHETGGAAAAAPPVAPVAPAPAVTPAAATAQASAGAVAEPPPGAELLRGAPARVVQNMERSLGMPTATSFRFVPAKLLEENRRVVNRFLAAGQGGKVSFTHLIGWSVVRALGASPPMRRTFVEAGGRPYVVAGDEINLGLAVDVTRKDGSRTLLVPNIKGAGRMDFRTFWAAYEDVIRRVRTNGLSPDDFAGTTVSLSNPGTIGTQLSVPRLMPQQGLIVAVGRIDYPTEYVGADPRTLATLGVGKVIGVTSTYDHRVIQGAESGEFLAKMEELLLGGDGFYEGIFASLDIPYEPLRWKPDRRAAVAADPTAIAEKGAAVLRLVAAYRDRGHLLANVNPLGHEVLSHPELDQEHYGLTVWDLDREFFVPDLRGAAASRTLRAILDVLRDSYCGTVGVEYTHIQDPRQKDWIQHRVEDEGRELEPGDMRFVLTRLNAAEAFEKFLHSKYVGHKRFSLEGAESLIPMIDVLLEAAAAAGVDGVVLGMAHRGRLNVLANIVGKSYGRIFREFEGDIDPETIHGSGDVQYHVGAAGKYTTRAGQTIRIEMASNPSHLESVDPVVEGMVRARQGQLGDQERRRVIPLLVHGDAAFAGEGVVGETLGMSQLPGFTTGGTVHVVVNNQLGFTTPGMRGRSSVYATDVAKMVEAPVLHVNGDDPEACVWAARLAFDYRQTFGRDVVIDLLCYRKYGHNEADDPSYTQPSMYAEIDRHRPVRKLYMEKLVNRGDITLEEAEAALEDYRAKMERAFDETRESAPPAHARPRGQERVAPPVETGVARPTLDAIVRAMTTWPDGFTPHPKLVRQLERRRDILEKDAVDWAMGEALAFGSLALEGIPVRISGQDSRRGTFSQRHAVWVDHETERKYYPLMNLSPDQAPFLIYDGPLNEFSTLAFEYGYSIVRQDALIGWEAQFGDFVNEAQVIIDQFVVAAEDKWDQTSGLVMLLPHGYEGQGPEHSSARIERFLELAAGGNIQVVIPSTPSQYFHLLRRQVHRDLRKPLIVFTPKSLLRLPAARSAAADLEAGSFREIIADRPAGPAEAVRRVVLCSGKVYYDLAARQKRDGVSGALLVRVEQLYPFPQEQLMAAIGAFPNATEIRIVQEEPENMGAYRFLHRRLHHLGHEGVALSHASRQESGSPATGSATLHHEEQEELLERAFEGL